MIWGRGVPSLRARCPGRGLMAMVMQRRKFIGADLVADAQLREFALDTLSKDSSAVSDGMVLFSLGFELVVQCAICPMFYLAWHLPLLSSWMPWEAWSGCGGPAPVGSGLMRAEYTGAQRSPACRLSPHCAYRCPRVGGRPNLDRSRHQHWQNAASSQPSSITLEPLWPNSANFRPISDTPCRSSPDLADLMRARSRELAPRLRPRLG